MPSLLPLVLEVVDLVDKAGDQQRSIDVEAEAARLLKAHPEADSSKKQIAALIREVESADWPS